MHVHNLLCEAVVHRALNRTSRTTSQVLLIGASSKSPSHKLVHSRYARVLFLKLLICSTGSDRYVELRETEMLVGEALKLMNALHPPASHSQTRFNPAVKPRKAVSVSHIFATSSRSRETICLFFLLCFAPTLSIAHHVHSAEAR